MANEKEKIKSPPYTSYSTFKNFVRGLKDTGVPSRIDKSVLSKMSGSAQAALSSALEWLGLTDSVGVPTSKLDELVHADDEQYSRALSAILKKHYPFLSDGSLDISKATGSQVEQKFRDFKIQGSTVIKSIAFFLAAAKDASITVGPHVKAPKVSSVSGAKRTSRKSVSEAKQGDTPKGDVGKNEGLNDRPGFIRIIIPLHGMDDGALYLPDGLTPRQRAYALNITKFLLDNYWLDDDTQDAIEQLEKENK